MIDPFLSLAHSIFSNTGVYAVLLGSGISSASGILTGWQVTLDLVRRLAALEGNDPGDELEAWYVKRYNKAPDYSDLLDSLAKTPAERRGLLHSYFEPTEEEREGGLKVPSSGHRAIARLVARGYFKVILTTNFDRLMETALRDEGIEPTVISTADAAQGVAPLVHQCCIIVKLNGDYLDERIKNTEQELGSYDPRMDAYLDRVLDEFGLIICGWSGDWDVALRAGMERRCSRRYTTYWASIRPLSPRADSLATLLHAEKLPIRDADTFFFGLDDKVTSLEELKSTAPLSAAAAVATLKRYIVDRQHRIRLHDLVMDETARVKQRLAAEIPVDNRYPDGTEFKRRILATESCTEILRHLFFQGGIWAEPESYEVFMRPQRMVVQSRLINGYGAWLDLQAFPVALLTYAGGLGAIAGRNYRMLREFLGVRFEHRGRERKGLESLTCSIRDAGDLPQSMHDQRRHTPMSDHLAGILEPLAATNVPDPELSFDILEIMIALTWLDAMDPLPSEPQWMPWGRFVWRRQRATGPAPVAAVLGEAAEHGPEWAPLQAGMFGGSIDRFQAVRTLFEASLVEAAKYFR
jgi:hypothetical protein